jgi:hypothetical protein
MPKEHENEAMTIHTLVRSLSKASLRLNIRRRSRILAARRCEAVATRRRFFAALDRLNLTKSSGMFENDLHAYGV